MSCLFHSFPTSPAVNTAPELWETLNLRNLILENTLKKFSLAWQRNALCGNYVLRDFQELAEKFPHPLPLQIIQYFGQLRDSQGGTLANYCVRQGKQKFTTAEILQLGNPADSNGNTLAHWCVSWGEQQLSTAEILKLGNPANLTGMTLAHYCIKYRNQHFTVAEILELGNPTNMFGHNLAFDCIRYNGQEFTIAERELLGLQSSGFATKIIYPV